MKYFLKMSNSEVQNLKDLFFNSSDIYKNISISILCCHYSGLNFSNNCIRKTITSTRRAAKYHRADIIHYIEEINTHRIIIAILCTSLISNSDEDEELMRHFLTILKCSKAMIIYSDFIKIFSSNNENSNIDHFFMFDASTQLTDLISFLRNLR